MGILRRSSTKIVGLEDKYYTKNQLDTLIQIVESNGGYTNVEIDEKLTGDIDLYNGIIHAQNVENKIDGDYGWSDLFADIEVRGGGSSSPIWAQFRNGIFAYQFRNGRTDECWVTFHINHDYAMGTKLYPHVHWSPIDTLAGNVRWGFEYTIAKGHQQDIGSVFGPTSIVYATHTISPNSEFKHFVTETSDANAIDDPRIEPDTIILMRLFREGGVDTHNANVAAFNVDMHYQTARFATKNKAPNFFGD